MARKDPLDGARAALDAARRGDPTGCDAIADQLEDALARADDRTRGLAVSVLAASARHAALGLDLTRVTALEERIADAHPAPTEGAPDVAAELIAAWRALLSGAHALAIELATAASARASERREPDLVVEASALAALARLASGDAEQGLRAARRASRMARTEGIPLSEALAHLVLARARRASGHAHLALLITRSLAALPLASHRGWLALEHALAGGARGDAPPVEHGLHRIASDLHAWREAAEAGDRPRFDAATASLRGGLSGAGASPAPPLVRDEVEALVLACDPHLDPRGTPIEAFLLGATSELPASLRGMATTCGGAPETDAAVLYAVQLDGAPPRRLARLGRALVGADVTAVRQSRRHQGRAETVIATLLLAGPGGLDERECFRAVYGFEFVPEVHRGALDVALHRAREQLGPLALLERQGGSIRLEPRAPLICPDPRAGRSLSDKILAVLAEQGAQSAKTLADAVGAPLRAAQAALTALVEDGACEARRSGRGLEYHLEDTTFSEPTYLR